MSEVRLAGLRTGTCVRDKDADVWVKTTFGATFVAEASETSVDGAPIRDRWLEFQLDEAERLYGPFTLIGGP